VPESSTLAEGLALVSSRSPVVRHQHEHPVGAVARRTAAAERLVGMHFNPCAALVEAKKNKVADDARGRARSSAGSIACQRRSRARRASWSTAR
jgi:hypothetical protein